MKETLTEGKRADLAFVWDAVKSLPVKYREVIHLFYYEGYPVKEIAGILQRRKVPFGQIFEEEGKLKIF